MVVIIYEFFYFIVCTWGGEEGKINLRTPGKKRKGGKERNNKSGPDISCLNDVFLKEAIT